MIAGDAAAVAEYIKRVHMKESVPIWYNNEQALSAVVKLAFFTYRDHYVKLEELPSGTGYADIAYIRKKYDPAPAAIHFWLPSHMIRTISQSPIIAG